MHGNQGTNIFFTGAGNDIAYGGADKDLFILGDGNNTVYGKDGVNIVITGSGNDIIYGGSDKDYIYAGAGNDLIYASRGDNIISAGIGEDVVYAGRGSDNFILDKGEGSVKIWNFDTKDKISLGSTLTKNDPITTKLSGHDTEVYAGNDLLATLLNTVDGIEIG
jgi:glycerophosphoryl diester phosphodiesterase